MHLPLPPVTSSLLHHLSTFCAAGGSNGSGAKPHSPQPKSPIKIQPLDTTTSLPTKMANLDLASIYPADGSERDTEDESSLQAYQPGREGITPPSPHISSCSKVNTLRFTQCSLLLWKR